MTQSIIPFKPDTFKGSVPTGHNIVIYEAGEPVDDGCVLLGFDELEEGMFRELFTTPDYAFVSVFVEVE